jgi:hypothetical protein
MPTKRAVKRATKITGTTEGEVKGSYAKARKQYAAGKEKKAAKTVKSLYTGGPMAGRAKGEVPARVAKTQAKKFVKARKKRSS